MSSRQNSLVVAVQDSFDDVATDPANGAFEDGFTVPTNSVNYVDSSVVREARAGDGARTPKGFRQRATKLHTINASGDLYYELVPWFMSGSLLSNISNESETPYTYDVAGAILSPSVTGAPKIAYNTAWVWNPANCAKFTSCFFDTWSISGNAQSGTLSWTAALNAAVHSQVTPTDFNPVTYQIEGRDNGSDNASLGLCHPLDISISTKDAGTTGGSFSGMTALNCNLLDWSISCTSAYRPLFTANGGTDGEFCSAAFRIPGFMFTGTFVTSAASYSAIRNRFLNETPLELQFKIGPDDDSRECTFNMTGYWTSVPSVHDESDELLVMTAEFTAMAPSIQTTSPHWLGWNLVTDWKYPFDFSL